MTDERQRLQRLADEGDPAAYAALLRLRVREGGEKMQILKDSISGGDAAIVNAHYLLLGGVEDAFRAALRFALIDSPYQGLQVEVLSCDLTYSSSRPLEGPLTHVRAKLVQPPGGDMVRIFGTRKFPPTVEGIDQEAERVAFNLKLEAEVREALGPRGRSAGQKAREATRVVLERAGFDVHVEPGGRVVTSNLPPEEAHALYIRTVGRLDSSLDARQDYELRI